MESSNSKRFEDMEVKATGCEARSLLYHWMKQCPDMLVQMIAYYGEAHTKGFAIGASYVLSAINDNGMPTNIDELLFGVPDDWSFEEEFNRYVMENYGIDDNPEP